MSLDDTQKTPFTKDSIEGKFVVAFESLFALENTDGNEENLETITRKKSKLIATFGQSNTKVSNKNNNMIFEKNIKRIENELHEMKNVIGFYTKFLDDYKKSSNCNLFEKKLLTVATSTDEISNSYINTSGTDNSDFSLNTLKKRKLSTICKNC